MSQSITERVVHYQEEHALEIIVLFIFLTVMMIPGIAKVETIVALENMMPSDSESVDEFKDLRAQGLGKDTIAVVVETGSSDEGVQSIMDGKSVDYIKNLQKRIGNVYGIESVQSPLRYDSLIDRNKDNAVIIAYTYVGDDGEKMSRIFSDIEEETSYNKPEGITTRISGVPAVQQRLASMVQRDKNVTTMVSLVFVFIITWILFSLSLTAALMPLIVVIFSVVWLYGTMGYMGIPLSALAGSVAALVIGIGIAYAIHFGNMYRFNRRDNSISESLIDTMEDIGISIIASAITTISAFMAFLAGMMPEMNRFGIIMSLGIGYSVVFTILFIPSVFVMEERLMSKVKKSLDWRKDFP